MKMNLFKMDLDLVEVLYPDLTEVLYLSLLLDQLLKTGRGKQLIHALQAQIKRPALNGSIRTASEKSQRLKRGLKLVKLHFVSVMTSHLNPHLQCLQTHLSLD